MYLTLKFQLGKPSGLQLGKPSGHWAEFGPFLTAQSALQTRFEDSRFLNSIFEINI